MSKKSDEPKAQQPVEDGAKKVDGSAKSVRQLKRAPLFKKRRIAISTGGGDAPGLNAVIRAATVCALEQGWEVFGIRDGFNGVLLPENYGGKGVFPLTRDSVRGITHLGGTILGTTNKGNPLHYPVHRYGDFHRRRRVSGHRQRAV